MPKETFLRLRPEKQERVMRAAVGEFVKNGFERTKVEAVAAAAGVAKGSMYQYFEDKREIFIYCAQWGLDLIMKKLDRRAPTDDMDVFEYFRETVSKTQVIEEERELALFMQSLVREPDLVSDSMQGMYDVADAYIRKLIRNGVKKSVVRADIDEDLLKEYFQGVTDRFERRWMERYIDFAAELSGEKLEAMQREVEQMLALLKNGMGC